MPITPYSKVAFRCNSCGRLHTCDDAAEAPHPHSCRLCGNGVTFNKRGIKVLDLDNWEVLSIATPERLVELGITADDVEQHEVWAKGASKDTAAPTKGKKRTTKNVAVSVEDTPGTSDNN